MARRARIHFPGLPLHVIQRGIDGAPCFFEDADRLVYLSLLEKRAAQFACAVHAYVLMSNHVHLLLTPSQDRGASLVMKHLGQEYVQYVNRTYGRTGCLWGGRFKSSLVDTEGYLLRCYRYVELNPVRAGMVSAPGHYAWSSHRANAWGRDSTLITPHSCYLSLGMTPEARLAAYEAEFGTPLSEFQLAEIRRAANGGFVLGGDAFVERMAEVLGRPAARRRKANATCCGRRALRAE